MARRKLIAGNWKMNPPTLGKAVALATAVVDGTRGAASEVLVIAPSPFLAGVGAVLNGTAVGLGAQNLHPDRGGAYTGEVAGSMLVDFGVRYVLCGHSERRQLFGESPSLVGAKVAAAHRDRVVPILCVGETLDERDQDRTERIVAVQLEAGLAGLDAAVIAETVIAYEPVWAIGTGRNATPAQAQAVHHFIRAWLAERVGDLAAEIRILYGGSVKAANAAELMAEPDVDGALVGGASLEAAGFAAIVHAADQSHGVTG